MRGCVSNLFAAASFGALMMVASPAAGETLNDALALAYQTNPTIRAERARLKAVRETRAQAWAGALPQVSASGALTEVDSSQTTGFPDPVTGVPSVQNSNVDLTTMTAGVTAEQPVFTGFRNYNAIKQAGARIRAGGAQLIATEQQVLLDVASAYFNVQRNMAVFELNTKNVAVLVRQKDMATARFDVGEITRTDVA
ncbi:MAG: TolC family protein, partial [Pseudomonadota bacterium]